MKIKCDAVIENYNRISTTSTRIFFTLLIIAWTAWDYIHQNDAPNSEWLMFLATLAGVDVLQAAIKRKHLKDMHVAEVNATASNMEEEVEEVEEENGVTATTDVSEIQLNENGKG